MPAEQPRRKRTTLAAVASAAGVSLPTVSKVINGRTDVAAETRARVEQALRDHQYVPQRSRRPRPTGRTLELLFDGLDSPYSSEILRGVVDASTEAGIDPVVHLFPAAGHTYADDNEWARRLASSGREGLIVVTSELTSAQVTALNGAGLPLVVIDPVNLPRADVVSVGATNWLGGLAAAEHLAGLGHRRIAYLGGPAGASCSQARLHGYRAALDNAGLAADPRLVRNGDFSYDVARALTAELLAEAKPPTAIFAGNDVSALGVIEAARAAGLRVPGDLSVVGFDDTLLALWSTPPLTTVRQPLRDMGRVAVRTLLRLAAGESLESHHVELATQLVVRSSTSAAG
ncbi:LacI family DNA-binding transcriptional regulator [Fodinicola acaciae]|uniref:LacI family DNA-binding transcriptional regulator n=1 Tax=Fodinicola acaciae TaxID=2681555 RepID=UPI0013D77EDE|nr:LacI family DNA-binding transcriptional regulator [Fodinicola acaciae]